MQSWLLRRTSLCLSPLAQQGARAAFVATAATMHPRRLYSTDVEPSTTTTTTIATPSATSHSHSSSSSHNGSNPLQQLYKSTHKGKGDKAMPKVMPRQQLKKRTIFTENEKTMEAEMKQQEEAGAVATPAAKRSKPLPKSRKITDMKEAEQLFGARSSCAEDAGPVGERALSPLQKRQLLFRNKAAFVLTPQALRRVKFLISQYHAHTQGKNGNKNKTKRNGSSATAAGAAEEEKTKEAAAPVAIPSGIRIGVRRRGCSGYSYTVNYYFDKKSEQAAAAPAVTTKGAAPKSALAAFMKDDVTVEQEGVKVVVEQDALFYVIGTEMDYVVRNVEEKFTFKNPNQKFSCGCEESFMPFDEDDLDD